MTLEEIVKLYQEGKSRQEAAMRKIRAGFEELTAANESVDSSMGLIDAFFGNLGGGDVWEGFLDGDNNMPRFMKSLLGGDFEGLF